MRPLTLSRALKGNVSGAGLDPGKGPGLRGAGGGTPGVPSTHFLPPGGAAWQERQDPGHDLTAPGTPRITIALTPAGNAADQAQAAAAPSRMGGHQTRFTLNLG
jgi:hypothetical protein